MLRRILEAWVEVATIRASSVSVAAEARVEAARLRADAILAASRLQAGITDDPEPETEPVPEDLARIEAWAMRQGWSDEKLGDVMGMVEAVSGYAPATDHDRRRFRSRLATLGVPTSG